MGAVPGKGSVARNAAWRALQVGARYGVTLLVTLIAARLLDPGSFGVYGYLMAVVFLLAIVGDFGISAAASRSAALLAATSPSRIGSLVSSASLAIAALGAAVSAALLLAGPRVVGKGTDMIPLLVPILFLSPLSSLLDGIYRGTERFRRLAIVSTAVGVLALPATWILTRRYGLAGAVGSQALFYAMLFAGLAPGLGSRALAPSLRVLREVVPFAATLGLANLAYFLYTRIDILVLERAGLVVDIGYYVLATRALDVLGLPFLIHGQAAGPRSTRLWESGSVDELRRGMRVGAALAAAGSALLCGATVVLAPVLIRLLLPAYDVPLVYTCLWMLLALLPVKAWGLFLTQGFLVPTGQGRIVLHSTWIGGLANVALDIALVTRFGLVGVVAATLAVHSVAIAAQTALYLRSLARARRNPPPAPTA